VIPDQPAQIPWARDELILACDLVRDNGWKELRAGDHRVAELSGLLRRPWLHPLEGRQPEFLSVNSVARKTTDLATRVPGYRGSPTKGGRLDLVVLKEFIDDPDGMRAIASRIKELVARGETALADGGDEVEDVGAREGRLLRSVITRRERDPKLRERKIRPVLRAGALVACEVCAFDFNRTYGARGHGYIEVHHRLALYASGAVDTRLTDLVLLCANCHRMIHRGAWITPEELRTLLADR